MAHAQAGIGPKTALQLLKRHGSLERVLATLDKSKHPVPEDFDFEEARRLFVEPEVSDAESLEVRALLALSAAAATC